LKEKKKQWISKEEALQKLQRYCAYQDRCHQEVRKKLLDLGQYGDDLEEIILVLIEEKFLDEERFARSYARGKFRMKRWGRVRIQQELKKRDLSDYCVRAGLSEIQEEAYRKALEEVLAKRKEQKAGKTGWELYKDLVDYGLRRGFEYELVKETVSRLLPKK
jgi:regulatory protein